MAPLKKKRVWNHSIDVFPPSDSITAKRRRKLIHSIVRRHVVQNNEEMKAKLAKDTANAVKIHGAIAWQQLRFIAPSTVEKSLQRETMLTSLLSEKLKSLATMLNLYGRMEDYCLKQNRLRSVQTFRDAEPRISQTILATPETSDPKYHPLFKSVQTSPSVTSSVSNLVNTSFPPMSPSSTSVVEQTATRATSPPAPVTLSSSIRDSDNNSSEIWQNVEDEVEQRKNFFMNMINYLSDIKSHDVDVLLTSQ